MAWVAGVGSTLIGSTFPGGGSTASFTTLWPLLGSVALRTLLVDTFFLQSGHLLLGPFAAIRAVWGDPRGTLDMLLFQFSVVFWAFAVWLPVFGIFALAPFFIVELREAREGLAMLFGAAYLVLLIGLARGASSTLLRWNLHRLVWLQQRHEEAGTQQAT